MPLTTMEPIERRKAARLKRLEAAAAMNPNRVPLDELVEFWPTPLTVEEFSILTTISEETLYRLIRARRLPCIRIGSLIKLDQRRTAEWLRARQS
jgi:excisionase family DNA binding protein